MKEKVQGEAEMSETIGRGQGVVADWEMRAQLPGIGADM